MDEILLSICIPTFNRKEITVECLERVFRSIESANLIDTKLQVLVVDNCSKDGTDIELARLQGKYPILEYNINKINIGFSGNFIKCIELARGSYVWVLGSDDLVQTEAIQNIVDIIIKYEPDAILQSFMVNGLILPKGRWLSGIVNNIRALKIFGQHVSFISSVIYKRANIIPVEEKYINSSYVGLRMTLLSLSKSEAIYLIRESMLLAGIDENAYDSYEIMCKLLFDIFNVSKSLNEFPSDVINNLIRTDLIKNVRAYVINQKLKGLSTYRQTFDLFSRYYFSWRYWLIILPLTLLPKQCIVILKRIKKVLGQKQK